MGEHELFDGNVYYYDACTNTKFLASVKPDACTSITVSSDDLAACSKTGSNCNYFSVINEDKLSASCSPIADYGILNRLKTIQITDTDEDEEEEAMDLHPEKIIFNDPVSVVFWEDGEKTVVRRHEGEPYDKYVAFCAALAIKIFGSNTEVNRIVSSGIDQQEKDRKKAEKTAKKYEIKKITKKQKAGE